MPDAHARYSPSSSKGWLKCAGRLVLEAAYPNVSNEFTDDGTAMHYIASTVLKRQYGMEAAADAIGSKVQVNDLPEPYRAVEFSEDMAAMVQGYVDTVRSLRCSPSLVEHRVDFSEFIGVPGQFGTSDFIGILPLSTGGDELVVVDLKTGWQYVDPKENTQGMLYALGAYREFELSHDIRSVRIGIYAPRHGGLSEWTISLPDLLIFGDWAKMRVAIAEEAAVSFTEGNREGWNAAYLHPDPNEEDCRFCRAMATCPAMRAKIEKTAGAAFDAVDPAAVPYFADDALSDAMAATGLLEDWIKTVRAEVERRLLAGMPVTGFGLELGRQGPRKWLNAESAEKMLREHFRLKIEDAYDLKLKSPTSVEKMVKEGTVGPRQWIKIQPLIVRSDPVPSVKPAAQIKTPYVPPQASTTAFSDESESLS